MPSSIGYVSSLSEYGGYGSCDICSNYKQLNVVSGNSAVAIQEDKRWLSEVNCFNVCDICFDQYGIETAEGINIRLSYKVIKSTDIGGAVKSATAAQMRHLEESFRNSISGTFFVDSGCVPDVFKHKLNICVEFNSFNIVPLIAWLVKHKKTIGNVWEEERTRFASVSVMRIALLLCRIDATHKDITVWFKCKRKMVHSSSLYLPTKKFYRLMDVKLYKIT